MNRVSFYACDCYEDRAALRRALLGIFDDCGGLETLVKKDARVVIKPNLVMRKTPESAATTHPALLEELILLVKERTDDITLVECPGGPGTAVLVEGILRTTGIRAVCDAHGVKIVPEPSPRIVKTPDAFAARTLSLSSEMLDAEVFINLGKLKSHSLTTFTGCSKNLYGAIPGLVKVEYHARFAEIGEFANLICDIKGNIDFLYFLISSSCQKSHIVPAKSERPVKFLFNYSGNFFTNHIRLLFKSFQCLHCILSFMQNLSRSLFRTFTSNML